MSNIYALVDKRWSNALTTYNGLWIDFSNGAGGAASGASTSRLFRLSNNGTDFFGIDLSGVHYLSGGTGTCLISPGVNNLALGGNGTYTVTVGENTTPKGLIIPADRVIGWASGNASGNAVNTADTVIQRDNAANTLALRNGTNGQAYHIYNTFTDVNNGEWLSIDWVGNNVRMYTTANGAGSALRNLQFGTQSGVQWQIFGNGGHIQAINDAVYDIGSAGANRPRSIYIAGNLTLSTNSQITTDTGTLYIQPQNSLFLGGGSGVFWQIPNTGHLGAINDNQNDIGASGANRPRNIYQGGFKVVGVFTWGSVSASVTPQEGMMLGCSTAATIAAGATVAASGTGHALLYYDGTQFKACM